ncbi:hypothetical protein CJ030_MR3G001918 [Morella rubra]|uniref:Uncharacterized protein n=1 Tax=Morella rubra TaxID=262757 RepID=A0A6A1W456_9ROSI|nr:hypothetical protein CJ030_MR3G001918 [Morella rubra]
MPTFDSFVTHDMITHILVLHIHAWVTDSFEVVEHYQSYLVSKDLLPNDFEGECHYHIEWVDLTGSSDDEGKDSSSRCCVPQLLGLLFLLEFYATILWVANLDEPSMEVTVRNTQVTFSPNELASFLGYKRPLAVFPNLPLSEMPRDISARLATLERKVGEVDSEWKKEVVVHRLALKDMASGA